METQAPAKVTLDDIYRIIRERKKDGDDEEALCALYGLGDDNSPEENGRIIKRLKTDIEAHKYTLHPETGNLTRFKEYLNGEPMIGTLEENLEPDAGPKAKTPKKKTAVSTKSGKPAYFKPARRISRSPETWRILSNYPRYEISSHGRVRSLDRARPDDWLKPRYRWWNGGCRASVVLLDKDGRRAERDTGWLLVAAGFLERPKFRSEKSSSVQ